MIFDMDMKAFQAGQLDTQLRQLAFSVLGGLCGRIGHLPDSYILSDKFDISGVPRASGEFTDVRMGVFRGKDVAIKSLRVSEVDDRAKIRKVGNQAAFLHPLTYRTALLRESYDMEESIPSKHPQSHRGS
jgi:hypothetical protein